MTKTQDTPAPPRTNALPTVNARIYPRGGLDILSRDEVARLRDASRGGMHDLLRRCTLAVLTTGHTSDDPRSDERRVGTECVRLCSSRWSTHHQKKKTNKITQ